MIPDPPKTVADRVTPDFEHVHAEMARPSVTLLLLWNEYIQDAGRLVGCLTGIRSSLNSIAGG